MNTCATVHHAPIGNERNALTVLEEAHTFLPAGAKRQGATSQCICVHAVGDVCQNARVVRTC